MNDRARPWALAAVLLLCAAALAGCVTRSGGAWAFRSAPTPEGWPELTPVGEVGVREYPAVRAAHVAVEDLPERGRGPMFLELFRHIDENDISMTAPVEMGYQEGDGGPVMASMSFLYRARDVGATGADGPVAVRDLEPRRYASVGVRGDYSPGTFERGLEQLHAWLADDACAWRAVGPPRFLGYNGPFTLPFLRYGEVQIPVEPRTSDPGP